jgi:hypothetical protein
MLSRNWNLTVSGLTELYLVHQFSKGLLKAVKEHLPDRVGGTIGWNFEKSVHKVREIVMRWPENISCRGPEHAHIDLIQNVAHHLTNDKDVFLCILRYQSLPLPLMVCVAV